MINLRIRFKIANEMLSFLDTCQLVDMGFNDNRWRYYLNSIYSKNQINNFVKSLVRILIIRQCKNTHYIISICVSNKGM